MGRIKSFSQKQGYGFIECEEIKDMGGEDTWHRIAKHNDRAFTGSALMGLATVTYYKKLCGPHGLATWSLYCT